MEDADLMDTDVWRDLFGPSPPPPSPPPIAPAIDQAHAWQSPSTPDQSTPEPASLSLPMDDSPYAVVDSQATRSQPPAEAEPEPLRVYLVRVHQVTPHRVEIPSMPNRYFALDERSRTAVLHVGDIVMVEYAPTTRQLTYVQHDSTAYGAIQLARTAVVNDRARVVEHAREVDALSRQATTDDMRRREAETAFERAQQALRQAERVRERALERWREAATMQARIVRGAEQSVTALDRIVSEQWQRVCLAIQ